MLLYRGLMSLAAPLFALWMAMRWVFGPETRITFLERLGWSRGRAPAGQTGLWVHAASNGELASVEPILRMLLARMPDLVILVTTNSQTGRDLAQGWELPRLHARVAPFDLRWCAARILRRWRVEALIVIESELWPNRLRATTNLGLPVLVLGARLSERTAKGWRKAWFLARHVLNDLTWI